MRSYMASHPASESIVGLKKEGMSSVRERNDEVRELFEEELVDEVV